MKIDGLTFRIALVQGKASGLSNIYTSSAPSGIARGNGVRLELALFKFDPKADSLYDDLSNVASLTMVMRKKSAAGDFLKDWVIPKAQFTNPAMTYEAWTARSSAQIEIDIAPDDTNYEPTETDGTYPLYFAFEVRLTNGKPIFFGSFTTSIFEEGIGNAGTPTPGDPSYLTVTESDARYGVAARDILTAAVPNGSDTVDFVVPAASAVVGQLGVVCPAGAANIFIVGLERLSDTIVRAHLSAATEVEGYQASIYARPTGTPAGPVAAGDLYTAEIVSGESTVDVTVAPSAANGIPLGIIKPNLAAPNIGILCTARVAAGTIRCFLTGAPAEAGYVATILAP